MSEVLEAAKTEAFLEHYGIKGMKWGVSKSSSGGGGASGQVGTGGSVGGGGAGGGGQKPGIDKKKLAIRVGAGAAAVAGAAVVGAILIKQGKTPARPHIDMSNKAFGQGNKFDRAAYDSNVRKAKSAAAKGYNERTQKTVREHQAKQDAGRAAARASQDVWKQNVNALLADMRQANREQDQYMRSQGLGAYVNNRD